MEKKFIIFILVILIFFSACTKQPSKMVKDDDYEGLFRIYKQNCTTQKAQGIYGDLCHNLDSIDDAKSFFQDNFQPLHVKSKQKGLLTGYYEPLLYGSLKKTQKYCYPLYAKPKDLLHVKLASIYPELKHYSLRGRLVNGVVVPYFTREVINKNGIDAEVLCYCDSKIDRFFLQVQGSGRVQLEDNTTLFLGYSDKNGYKYRSIGKYLIQKGAIKAKDISLQTITKWLQEHPQQVDEVLSYNESFIFFKKKQSKATGALGLELTPYRSVAVDTKYIPLGTMLLMQTRYKGKKINKIVFAQDRGGAIKGAQRADLFLGSSKEAREMAGELKAPLELWILVPKKQKRVDE